MRSIRNTTNRLAFAVCLMLAGTAGAQAGIVVEIIPASEWGRPDEQLGLGSGIVEDFEDTSLVAGLLFEIADAAGNFSGVGTSNLPNVYDPVGGDPYGDAFVEGVWDGSHALVNTEFNQAIYYGSADWRPIAFTVPGGASYIALACQQVTVSHQLMVNGEAVGRLAALGFELTPERNGVLVVRSDDPSTPIVSISFGGRGDAFVVDHLVFAPSGTVAAGPSTLSGLKALFR